MGGQISSKSKLKEQLSDEQIEIVKHTWKKYLACDLERTGMTIFTRLFQTEASIQPLFIRLASNRHVRGSQRITFDQHMLRHHAIRVMEALGAAVESLDDSESLAAVLQSLGETHIHYQVKPEMLKKLWPSIKYGLQQAMGANYNADVERAWRAVFLFLVGHMKQGMVKEMQAAKE